MDLAHYTVTTPYAQPLRQAFHKGPTKDLCVHSAIYFNPVLLQKVHCNTEQTRRSRIMNNVHCEYRMIIIISDGRYI
jgi:hypothetical protein